MIKIINFCHTHPSSSSPHYLSFFSVLSSCVISYYLTLFIISFYYPFPPLTFYYNHPVVHLFFLSSSYHPFSPCAHNHSSPPSSYFPIHIFLSYYHATSPCTQFFLLSSSWNIYRLFHLHPSPSALINLSSFPPSVMIPATYRCSRLPNMCSNKSVAAVCQPYIWSTMSVKLCNCT